MFSTQTDSYDNKSLPFSISTILYFFLFCFFTKISILIIINIHNFKLQSEIGWLVDSCKMTLFVLVKKHSRSVSLTNTLYTFTWYILHSVYFHQFKWKKFYKTKQWTFFQIIFFTGIFKRIINYFLSFNCFF
jgi:hypothetical protein